MITDHEYQEKVRAAQEARAPIVPGPLPFRAVTLDYVPAAKRPNYGRTMDGKGWQLLYLNESDQAERLAYVTEIATDTLHVYPDGVTPAVLAAQEATRLAGEAEVPRLVREYEERAKRKRLDALDARHAKETARLAAERERLTKSYRR